MMAEREDVAAKREACTAMLRVLHEALATLDALPQTLLSRLSRSPSAPPPPRCVFPSRESPCLSPLPLVIFLDDMICLGKCLSESSIASSLPVTESPWRGP